MLRVSILLLFVIVVFGDHIPYTNEDIQEGEEKECYDDITLIPVPDEVKECFSVEDQTDEACDFEICVATKLGTASDDGTVDREAIKKYYKDHLGDHPSVLSNVLTNCAENDVSKYGAPDACEVKKMAYCVNDQIIAYCKGDYN